MKNFLKLVVLVILTASVAARADAPQSSAVTPDQALQRLTEGNARFVAGKMLNSGRGFERDEALRQKQKPFAAILSCSDSRVPPEIIFDQKRGDIFVVRVAGNTVDPLSKGSLEYATAVLGASLVVVLGHEKCGAVDATLKGEPLPGSIEAIATLIKPALQDKQVCAVPDKLDCAIRDNVHWLVQELNKSSPLFTPAIQQGKLKVIGAYYDLDSGKVEIIP